MGNLIPTDIRARFAPPLETQIERLPPAEKAEFLRELGEARTRLRADVAAIDAELERWEDQARAGREEAARLELRRRELAAALDPSDAASASRARVAATVERRVAATADDRRSLRERRDELEVRLAAIKDMIADTDAAVDAAQPT